MYDGTANFLRELELDDDTLTKAIIGTIGDVDSYQLPDAKGYSRYEMLLPIKHSIELSFHGVYCIDSRLRGYMLYILP